MSLTKQIRGKHTPFIPWCCNNGDSGRITDADVVCGIKIPGKKIGRYYFEDILRIADAVAAGRQSQKAIWAKRNVSRTM
jgi:hypothetical protein